MPTPPPPEHTRWKKGQSGNPAGYSRGRREVDALMDLIAERGAGKAITSVWLKAILERDFRYFKEYLDRRDGKVADHIITEQQEIIVQRKDKPKRKRGGAKRPPRKPPSGSGAGD